MTDEEICRITTEVVKEILDSVPNRKTRIEQVRESLAKLNASLDEVGLYCEEIKKMADEFIAEMEKIRVKHC